METVKGESLAHLRHELKTPLNHILGYSDLLIEEAGERHLEAFVPAFEMIRSGGHQLLESIQSALAEKPGSAQEVDVEAFKQNLRGAATVVLKASTSLQEDLDDRHRQTLADLAAISWGLSRLIEFTGEGEGAFTRILPSSVRRTQPPSPKRRMASGKKRGGKILIADDNTGNRDLLRRRLECDDHQVFEAKNGSEALAFLADKDCDLVLLDILMPEMDGFETLAKLKQDPKLRELPVIMISALGELDSVIRCIEMGADDFLPKPFNRILLRARIGASLEKKWLRDRERRKTEELEQTLQLLQIAQTQLVVQATHDALTGLENRRSVDSHLDRRSDSDDPFSVIYMDLNGFKKINDTYGHQAGDELLRQVGERLRLVFRSSDIIGRWGGDEFVALVEADGATAQACALRIAESFSREFSIPFGETERQVNMTAAVGIATRQHGESIAAVLQRADAEMYEQKLQTTP